MRGPSGKTLIATAAHVVYDGGPIHVLQEFVGAEDQSKVFRVAYPEVEVVAVNFEADLALLEIRNLPDDRLVGMDVDLAPEHCSKGAFIWGYPSTVFGSGKLALTKLALASATPMDLDVEESFANKSRVLKKGAIKGLVFSPMAERGSSGGPVVDAEGKVVAVVVQKSALQTQGAAVCASYLAELAKQAEAQETLSRQALQDHVLHLTKNILPYARRTEDRPPLREWIAPQGISYLKGFFNEFIMLLVTSSFGSNTLSGSLLLDQFHDLFPSMKEGSAFDACPSGEGFSLDCVAETAVPDLAIDAIERYLGLTPDITEFTVNSDPEEIDVQKHIYQVNVSFKTKGCETRFQKLKLRRNFGRVWLEMPDLTSAIINGDPNLPDFLPGTWTDTEDGSNSSARFTIQRKLTIEKSGADFSGRFEYTLKATAKDSDNYFGCSGSSAYTFTGSFEFSGKIALGGLVAPAEKVERKGSCHWKKDVEKPTRIVVSKSGEKVMVRVTYGDGTTEEREMARQ